MANYYCEYCGTKSGSLPSLLANFCSKHPQGTNMGKHKLYEGSEKLKYNCKFCGSSYPNLVSLTSNFCSKHPNGTNKGKHAPAL